MSSRTVSRRAVSAGILALAAGFVGLPILTRQALAAANNLLDPDRLKNFPGEALVGVRTTLGDNEVLYADYPPDGQGKPPILYFHGWGEEFGMALPREYMLAERGYRIIMPNRPGYRGTTPGFGSTATHCADMAKALLDDLKLDGVHVMGTSGGGPAALCFANQYRDKTKSLVLQCAITHPWNGKRNVPRMMQEDWDTNLPRAAFVDTLEAKSRQLGEKTAQLILPALLRGDNEAARQILLEHETLLDKIVGRRKVGVLADPASMAYIVPIFKGMVKQENDVGKKNDVADVFLDSDDYFRGEMPPTLIIHDPEDPFVPFVHASYANVNIANSEVLTTNGGHFMWLGSESVRLENERIEFLNRHQ